jgi:nucleoside-diphosphate-sugar epimerase
MKLLITGAGGFLGKHVVAAAVRRGHRVRALLRPASRNLPNSWQNWTEIEVAYHDLRDARRLEKLLDGIDAIIHLAAAKSGDLYEQFGGTVLATENLLKYLSGEKIRQFVLPSSFSVYEYMQRREWSKIDESTPLAIDPYDRDEYCQTKLVQEKMVLEDARAKDYRCAVLRPGVIYGQNNLWTARLGMQLGERRWLRTGTLAPLPLTYVENCAEAMVLAAEYDGPQQHLILNVVDDETPSQRSYMQELRKNPQPRPSIIPIPWTVIRLAARLAWLGNRVVFQGSGKIPGLLVPSRLHARCKPFRYTNQAIKETLGWQPRHSWKEGVARSVGASDTADLATK